MLIGSIIRKERESRGWSQLYLANLVGVTQGYIALLEKGFKIPNVAMIIRLSDALHVTTDKLLKGAEK